MTNEVLAWEEEISIPTYAIGAPEKNPMFLENRVYQGSSGVIYPYAIIEKISHEKADKVYKAVFLENSYLKIMILPELGGRVQMAYDKIKRRHFIYYNKVVKPALVGLTGPWISGGIEFNWPQHHRPSTFDPIDHTIRKNADGSRTVWVNEVERMTRTKGMAGFTLYPGKAYLEVKGKLYNRTPFPQTFLWWANPAVKVNDHYQSVFPPDVHAVYDHGRRDVSSFPIATGVYYKVDYSPGTDISRYRNIPVPTSYMAVESKYDFIGGYEHDTGGGLMHVADHHVAPGKKQWTWGNGEFGKAWDKQLTDEDGPYIELMTGVFTDNQPDFAWIQPYEEKTFAQYFMPYRDLGLVKNATKDAMVNIEFDGNEAEIGLYTTSVYERLEVALWYESSKIFSEQASSSPRLPYAKRVVYAGKIIPQLAELVVTDLSSGRVLLSYRPEATGEKDTPAPAPPAKRPADVTTNEQLYLTGLHLEQYRHATYSAADYFEEALRRDENDIRSNNGLGLWYLRRGKFAESEVFFRRAVAASVGRNPNPYDGEPYYNLGLALSMQGRGEEAYGMFYKCSWNDAWQHAAFLHLAWLNTEKNDYENALDCIERALIRNYHSYTAWHAKTFILRKLGRRSECYDLIEQSLEIDPFNFGCLFEKLILLQEEGKVSEAQEVEKLLMELSRNWVHNFIEYALDYAHAGLWEDACRLLLLHVENVREVYPMLYYYLGWFSSRLGKMAKAIEYCALAESLSPDHCFPNRVEDILVLRKAIGLNDRDARAYYYLGNLWYDKKQYMDAIDCWERSALLESSFPTTHRNLALAYFNKSKDPGKAILSMETAFRLDREDARVLMELDQLYKKANRPAEERLCFLEEYLPLVMSRQDLYLERIRLNNQLGNYQEARLLLENYRFQPWEGGEGKVIGQYLECHIGLARKAVDAGDLSGALSLLEQARHYPETLGEGKIYGTKENDIFYWKGLAYEQSSMPREALHWYQKATQGKEELVQAIFYNDAPPDKIFYQGMSWRRLGRQEKADAIFSNMIAFADKHLDDSVQMDYFAVSFPEMHVLDTDLTLRNRVHCLYIRGLGCLGLGNGRVAEAIEAFDEALKLDINHQGASVHKQLCGNRTIIH